MSFVTVNCPRCTGLEQELASGHLDEILCTYCGQHQLRSTNHKGLWRVWVETKCLNCRNHLPNTDGYETYQFMCHDCGMRYEWTKNTGWELYSMNKTSTPPMPVTYKTKIPAQNPNPLKDVVLPSKKELFQKSRDLFLNAKNDEDAAIYLDTMLSYVDQDFGWDWIEEAIRTRDLPDKVFYAFRLLFVCFLCVGLPIMSCLGMLG